MDFDGVSQTSVRLFERPGSDIRIRGYLKKLKTMKKKYFVLRSTSSSGPARLEYYDSEKKFNAGHLPKRSILLHTCFNINRKSDGRHKYAIALYTKEECFSIVCEDEKEQETWLSSMLEYQDEYIRDDERCREHYEHVWQVTVQQKGLGHTKNLRGSYRLCMTRHNICLVKLNSDKPQYVFQLETVRSLAHSENLFRLEVGKIAPTGEGELWMQADDAVTAQNLHETILSYMKNMERRGIESMQSSSTLPRPDFRNRTGSESHTQGSGRTRFKSDQRPVSVYTSRSISQSAVSPGTSPLTQGFGEHAIMGAHRLRSDSSESKTSRSSIQAPSDDLPFLELHPLPFVSPLEEEPDFDQQSIPSSPGSHLPGDFDEYDGHPSSYIEMHPGSATPPTSTNSGYISMAPGSQRDSIHSGMEVPSSYMPMNANWSSPSAPIPIQDVTPGYMDMSHTPLPPVKEGGSNEGYLPMSPSYSASPSGSSSGHLRPDLVVCQLRDDVTDSQPHLRTYSLGSRPVKPTTKHNQGYMDMTVKKGVSDNGRSCSAPHLINHHPHHGRGLSSAVDSPTPSASPLSVSLKSDDSDSFMELEFYRPRTASDSYSYRPRASSFGVQQKPLVQGHRPRSSSHGQGTRPVRRHKLIGMDAGRLSHEMLHRTSFNSSSHGSFDSLRVSSSESLRKLSLEVRAKTSQLNNADYMDMSFDKRYTPSPQPGSLTSHKHGQNGYVDMTLGASKSSPGHSKTSSRSSSKTNSMEKLQDAEYTNMTLGGGDAHHHQHHHDGTRDSVYINVDTHEAGSGQRKHESPSRSSPAESADSYIPYEPASASSKAESTNPAPRNRSGSAGKEHKKWGFFSLRHGHGDSSKQTSKKSESLQQSRGSTGEKVVNLGHDIRRKNKDSSSSSKGGRQKSASFSRLLESRESSSKPSKASRKVPTPPRSSEEAMDEYIEFSPMVTKSDSDSSHSSGSTRTSKHREEVVAAKAEPEYVGFEPGNIVSSKGSSGTSGYVPMGNPSIGGQASVFKPVAPSAKSSEGKRSRGKKDTTPTAPTAPREMTFQPVHSHTSQKPPVTSTVDAAPRETSASHTSAPVITRSKSSPGPITSDPTCQTEAPPAGVALPGPALPTLPSPLSIDTSSVPVPVPSPVKLVPSPVKAGGKPEESGYLDFDPGKPLPTPEAGAGNMVSPSSSVASGSRGVGGRSPTSKDKQPAFGTVMAAAPGSLPVVMEVTSSSSETLQSSVTSSPRTEPSPTSAKVGQIASAKVGQGTASSPRSGSDSPSAGATQDTRVRKLSGGKTVTRPNTQASPGDSSSKELASSGSDVFCKPGDSKTKVGGVGDSGDSLKSKDVKPISPRTAQGPQPLSSIMPSLVRPESTPCMQSLAKPGVGRGRHSSAGSKSSSGSSGGNGGGNKGTSGTNTLPCMLNINTGAEARHSITDLSGYEQMTFPSDALSRQQPIHTHNRQTHNQPQQGSGSGTLGGSQGVLNYAQLDLGSADSVGESGDTNRSPRNKSRHPSSADERGEPLSYATIDFQKSESLCEKAESMRNSGNKDVKFTL